MFIYAWKLLHKVAVHLDENKGKRLIALAAEEAQRWVATKEKLSYSAKGSRELFREALKQMYLLEHSGSGKYWAAREEACRCLKLAQADRAKALTKDEIEADAKAAEEAAYEQEAQEANAGNDSRSSANPLLNEYPDPFGDIERAEAAADRAAVSPLADIKESAALLRAIESRMDPTGLGYATQPMMFSGKFFWYGGRETAKPHPLAHKTLSQSIGWLGHWLWETRKVTPEDKAILWDFWKESKAQLTK
jgi:hypothetical protein